MITVVIPVGPKPIHKQWLQQAIDSVIPQLDKDDDLLLIDDMANLPPQPRPIRVWRSPWLVGCADGWNIGISFSRNDLCLMMAADDWLEPRCLEHLKLYWMRTRDCLGYYALTIKYVAEPGASFDWPEIQDLPCNAAMVHKELWKHTGGFPPCAGTGAPDALLISVMMANADAGNIYQVMKGTPLYNVRVHPQQETSVGGGYWDDIISIRNKYTATWRPATWARYDP